MIGPTNIRADPDPRGGQLILSWTNPILPGFKGTQVLRREREFPSVPVDVRTSENVVFDDTTTPAGGAGRFLDSRLKSEVTYYYAIVAYDSAFRPFPVFVSGMTSAPYQTAAYLYRKLPGIYREYDAAAPVPSAPLDPADVGKGPLLRLVEMFGPQFDLLRSYASGMRNLFDTDQIDGTFLPLLAQWIGWQTNFTETIGRQRNDVKFAPHYYATTGVAANLRATINRLVPWDAQIKEFAHNIFLSNRPEELSIHEQQRRNNQRQPATTVSLDVAYEGRPSPVLAGDGRPWIFYHARQGGPDKRADEWHVWYKICDRDDWLPAYRLTRDSAVNKGPCAVQRASGNMWLFWSSVDPDAAGRPVPQIKSQQLSAGRPALNARVEGTNTGPFAFADGDSFAATIGTLPRMVTLRTEQFADIAHATASEAATLLDRKVPGVDVTATPDGRVRFASQTSGAGSQLIFPNSTAGAKLGIPGSPAAGADALPARITGVRTEPFALATGDALVITVDGDIPRTITFASSQTSAAQVAAAINQVLPGIASPVAGRIQLTSQRAGASSLIAIDVNSSTAASKLGFGAPLPTPVPGIDDTEPSGFEDATGNVWLFWSSLRNGQWKIWYSRFDGTNWAPPKPLTTLSQPDREPFALFDPAGGGRIWVFWSRKKANGLWNVFFRTTTKLDFNTLADADWTEFELTPVPANYDNREPSAVMAAPGSVDLYFTSNRTDGWKIWNKTVTPTTQAVDTAITTGQFTHRAPVPLNDGSGTLRLLFRTNESVAYTSAVYPTLTTIDARYAGSTTVDTRNAARMRVPGSFHDIGHYTYDTPKSAADAEARRWVSRDTVGLFLAPDSSDQVVIDRHKSLIADALAAVLPIQVRAVLLTGETFIEFVYSYDQRDPAAPQLITDGVTDTLS